MEAIVFIILQIFFSQYEQFWKFSDIHQFWLGNIPSHDIIKPIAHERKYLMNL